MAVTIEYKEGQFYLVYGPSDKRRVMFPKDSQHQSAPVLMGLDYATGNIVPGSFTSEGKVNVAASIVVEDIEIGAVEIKNSTTDDRVNVEVDDTKMAMYVQSKSLATQTTLNSVLTAVAYSTNKYYRDQGVTALTAAYQSFALGFTSKDTVVINDSDTNYIEVSFDGVATHLKLLDGEGFDFSKSSITTIYLRGQAGGESYRLISC